MSELRKYAMGPGPRKVVIVNNVEFDSKLKKRDYSDIDAANLLREFTKLRFIYKYKRNLEVQQMKDLAKETANEIAEMTEPPSCLVFVVMTYGEFGVLHGKDKAMQADELLSFFKGDRCPKMAGRPKIFIFQACCPELYGLKSRLESDDDSTEHKKMYKIPAEADFHITWSLIPGALPLQKAQARDPSLFLGSLGDILQREVGNQEKGHAPTEYTRLVTRAIGLVDDQIQRLAGEQYKYSDFLLPCAISMLTKALGFPLAEVV